MRSELRQYYVDLGRLKGIAFDEGCWQEEPEDTVPAGAGDQPAGSAAGYDEGEASAGEGEEERCRREREEARKQQHQQREQPPPPPPQGAPPPREEEQRQRQQRRRPQQEWRRRAASAPPRERPQPRPGPSGPIGSSDADKYVRQIILAADDASHASERARLAAMLDIAPNRDARAFRMSYFVIIKAIHPDKCREATYLSWYELATKLLNGLYDTVKARL